jgi:hypothetical protein
MQDQGLVLRRRQLGQGGRQTDGIFVPRGTLARRRLVRGQQVAKPDGV